VTTRGRLFAGTSGFAYPAWAPRFYPPGLRPTQLLPAYAERLDACELNNTFYRWPAPDRVAAWAASTPASFRFCLKAQRTASLRGLGPAAPVEVARLAAPLAGFQGRLGAILYRVPETIERADERLEQLLAAWPRGLPIAVELQHPSWQADETFERLRAHDAVLVATEVPEDEEPPTIRLTGPFLYLRLRRHDYDATELAAWAARIEPFVAAGHDAFVFFRHDEAGRGGELALQLREAMRVRAAAEGNRHAPG
jgi:uncharacterized protein YecE (DUF72 family)